VLGQWRSVIPLQPWAIRGFSNEESIHTAPIQLTLSTNPLCASVPHCAHPARSSPLSSFLLSLFSISLFLFSLSRESLRPLVWGEQRRRNLFYAFKRAGTCPRPPSLLLTFRLFSCPLYRARTHGSSIYYDKDSNFLRFVFSQRQP